MDQLKNNIIDKINLLNDQSIIEALGQIVDKLNSPKKHNLNASEKELIEIGLKNYKEGQIIDDSKLREEEERWLNE